MGDKQNIVVVQKNNNGCGCGCGTLITTILAFALAGYLLQEYGPIVIAVAGFFIGAWAGLKVSGTTIEELSAIHEDEWDARQIRGACFMVAGALLFALAGWGLGTEMIEEMKDNKEAVSSLFSIFLNHSRG